MIVSQTIYNEIRGYFFLSNKKKVQLLIMQELIIGKNIIVRIGVLHSQCHCD